jgi:hypothetical protein
VDIKYVIGTPDFSQSGAFAVFPATNGVTVGQRSVLLTARPRAHAMVQTPKLQSAQERSP